MVDLQRSIDDVGLAEAGGAADLLKILVGVWCQAYGHADQVSASLPARTGSRTRRHPGHAEARIIGDPVNRARQLAYVTIHDRLGLAADGRRGLRLGRRAD